MADDPLAALGITVQRLQDAIKAQAADIAQLQAQVNSAPAATTQVQAPWWLDLSDADRAARLDSLKTWVAEVLVIEYAGYFAPGCPAAGPGIARRCGSCPCSGRTGRPGNRRHSRSRPRRNGTTDTCPAW